MKTAITQKIKGIKILHLIQRVVKFFSFHVRFAIRVLSQELNEELYMCVKVM